jgi:hypothetical protein
MRTLAKLSSATKAERLNDPPAIAESERLMDELRRSMLRIKKELVAAWRLWRRRAGEANSGSASSRSAWH